MYGIVFFKALLQMRLSKKRKIIINTNTEDSGNPCTNQNTSQALYQVINPIAVTSGRNEGGSGGLNPPKCARKCANFRNLKANVQILDRKTPPNGLPYFAYWRWPQCNSQTARQSRFVVVDNRFCYIVITNNTSEWVAENEWVNEWTNTTISGPWYISGRGSRSKCCNLRWLKLAKLVQRYMCYCRIYTIISAYIYTLIYRVYTQ